MFDLGYKQIVINSDAVVTTNAVNGNIDIEGFGSFAVGSANTKFSEAAVAPVAGNGTIAEPITIGADGTVYDVRITLKGAPRILSEIFSGGNGGYGDSGQILAFQTVPISATYPSFNEALAASIIEGHNDKILTFDGAGNYEFADGYEGLNIIEVEAVKSGAMTAAQAWEKLVVTGEDTGTEGYGNGKQVEAEVRNATWDNTDSYGIQFGGSTSVDVRGKYKTIMFEIPAALVSGWEPHANLGYGDAQTETTYGNVKFIAFCNEASAATAAGLIESI